MEAYETKCSSMERVAVVILNWNGRALMEQFLPSVLAHSPREIAEVVVADNGSTDDSVEMLREKFPTVRIIELKQNYGFAEGYNQVLKQIETPYTVLLNSDVEVSAGWLNAPLAALDADECIACVQPKILAQRDKAFFEYAGACGGYVDRYGYPFCRGRVLHVVEKDLGQYDTPPTDVLWTTGACLFVRTAIYKEEGGLDADFFAHQEEIDFCWRLRSRGYRLVCTPASVVYHVGAATLSVENPRKTFLNFRNSLLMVYKNSTEEDLKRVLRVRFCLDYVAALKFLLTGHLANARAVYEARKAFFALLPAYESKRRENLLKRKLAEIPELYKGCLIFAFYVKGKKRYSDF